MSSFQNLSGQNFGKLTVVKLSKKEDGFSYWECLCECGKTTVVTASNLKSGNTKTCSTCSGGTHREAKNRLYKRWNTLKYRDDLCEEWLDISIFLRDVESSYKEGYSLRRLNAKEPHSFSNSFWVKPRKSTSVLSERIFFNSNK